MNKDLFRHIATRYLSYKTCKSLSLSFKKGNVLTDLEKLHKYSVYRGLEYCIKIGYYDGFLEWFWKYSKSGRQKTNVDRYFMELALKSNQVIIFDYLYHECRKIDRYYTIYSHSFTCCINTNLQMQKYLRTLSPGYQYGYESYLEKCEKPSIDVTRWLYSLDKNHDIAILVILVICIYYHHDHVFNDFIKDVKLSDRIFFRGYRLFYKVSNSNVIFRSIYNKTTTPSDIYVFLFAFGISYFIYKFILYLCVN